MRLVVFSEDTISCNESGHYRARNPLTKLYGELSTWFQEVVVSGPVYRNRDVGAGYAESRIVYSPRPYYGSVSGFFTSLPGIIKPTLRNITTNVKEADLIMIRLPSPIGYFVFRVAKKYRKPYFLYVAGDIRSVPNSGDKYKRSHTRVLAKVCSDFFHVLNTKMAQDTLVFATGTYLCRDLKLLASHCVSITPSVISSEDLYLREDISLGDPVRVLYVGRLVPVKGIPYLLRAIRILLDKGLAVTLQIVGDGYDREALAALVDSIHLTGHVNFWGHVDFGPKLLRLYREADVFVLPSLSEGIPKTLLEAAASGVPIVTTNVGGIPDIIQNEHTGILVNPRSSEEIVTAVERLIKDEKFRQTLIRNGYILAREYTVEKQARHMWKEISTFFGVERQ